MEHAKQQRASAAKEPTGAESLCGHSELVVRQAMVRLHAEFPQSHEGALRGVRGPLGETDDPHREAADGQPVAVDLMCGGNAPLTKALLYCGWKCAPVDLVLDPGHDLASAECQPLVQQAVDQACLVLAAIDCSTKSSEGDSSRHRDTVRSAETAPERRTSHGASRAGHSGTAQSVPRQRGL